MSLRANVITLFLVCFLLFGTFSIEADESSKTVTIPMDFMPWSAANYTNQFAGEYIVTITIGGVEVKAFVDTWLDGAWVLNQSCTTCHSKGVPKYNTRRSPTFYDLEKNSKINYLMSIKLHSLYGRLGYEKIGFQKFSNLTVPFLAAYSEDKDSLKFYNDSEAGLGVGKGIFSTGGLMDQMKALGFISDKKLSMAFSKSGQSELTFGGSSEDKIGDMLCEVYESTTYHNAWDLTYGDGLYVDNSYIFPSSYAVIASDTPYIVVPEAYANKLLKALASASVVCAIDPYSGFIMCYKNKSGKFTMDDAKPLTMRMKKTDIEIAKEDLVEIDSATGVATYRIMSCNSISSLLILGSPFLYNHYFVEQKNSLDYLKMGVYSLPEQWYVKYKLWLIIGGAAFGGILLIAVLCCVCKKCKSGSSAVSYTPYYQYAPVYQAAPAYQPPPPTTRPRVIQEAKSQPASAPPRRITPQEVLLGMIAGALTVEYVAQKLFALIHETLQQNAHLGRAGQKVILLSMIKSLPEILADPAFQSFTVAQKTAIVQSVGDKIIQVYGDW